MVKPTLLNREDELAKLGEAWKNAAAGRPQLTVLWGRRRVGKTFLLSHFASDRRSVFFGATQQAQSIELTRLAEAIRRDLGADVADLGTGALSTWEAALRFLAAVARDEPLLVVLDEVPYLARSTPGFASIVQAVWDHLRPRTKLMLVLTGSAIGTIKSMLEPRGALRGRPTLTLRLDPLDAPPARQFLPRLDPVAFIEAYAACGGYPLHLREWDQGESTDRNLLRLAGTAGGILLEDAQAILREELPETGGYARILAAIGRGRTRFSEIQDEAEQRVEHPLEVLVRADFVQRSLPVGAPKRARPLYEIADPYIRFWFSVLYSDLSLIEGGQGRAALRRLKPRWLNHLGHVFEDTARCHARRLVAAGELPADLVLGRWWATSGEPCEVDVLGLIGNKTHLVGEARWQERPLTLRELKRLQLRIARVPQPVDQPLLVLWGRSGVDKEVSRQGALGFDIRAMIR